MLYLYKQISPNLDDTHFYFNTPTQYKNALASSLVKSVSLDNYRINTNVIKVTLDATITEAVADTLTYAIDERSENGVITYFRCYHVNRINIQSGFVILTCSIDLWASYLYKASITNLNVTRCNRNIGVGLLDDMTGTKGTYTRTFCAVNGRTAGENNELWDVGYAYIVFALKFNISQNSDGAISRIRLYAFNLQELKRRYYNLADAQIGRNEHGQSNDPMALYLASIQNAVELAKDIVSGIYGIKGYNGFNVSTTLNAVVLGAWFCPNISATQVDDTKIASMWHHKYANDIEISPLEVVNVEVNIPLTITNNFDKQLYVGSRQNGLKLQRTTEATISVNIKITPSTDKLTIVAMQGDNQQDITQAFAVTIGTTDGDITAERQLLTAFESATKIIGSGFAMVKGATSGNAFALTTGILGLSNSVADAIGKGRSNHIGGQISGGDGGLAFYRAYGGSYDNPELNAGTPITNPFVVNAYDSINDEKANVRVYGARFSELTNFASIFNATLLGTGTLQSTFVCAHCNVDNIPTEAGDAIKNKLQTGIYLVNLTA